MSLSCVGVSSWSCTVCKLHGNSFFVYVVLFFVSGLNECETSCYRSSNRDPGAKAADSLSAKDHEGVWFSLIPAIIIQRVFYVVFFCCFLLHIGVFMHPR